jgi:hypothetical protein
MKNSIQDSKLVSISMSPEYLGIIFSLAFLVQVELIMKLELHVQN